MTRTTGPLVVIDGHNTFIRNYVRSPYTDANGERKGGTTGMVISVRKVINDFGASNCLVVWDGEGGSQRRRSIYKEYKAGRKIRMNRSEDDQTDSSSPEEDLRNMREQRDLAQEYLTILGVPQVRCDGVEADDLMAYVAGKMDHPGGCIVVTTDQDLLQLIRENDFELTNDEDDDCPNGYMGVHNTLKDSIEGSTCHVCGVTKRSEVRVYSPVKKVMYDRKRFISDYSVLPENFRLVKALTGDSSDNIEGIKGFGERTVAKSFPFLLQRRATAQDVLTAAEGIKGVLGKRLIEEKSRFLENLTLVDLSEPMLSGTAARQARDALRRDIGLKEVEFRVKLVKDAISFGGDNFTGPFRDMTMRRRRMLKETESVGLVEETLQEEGGEPRGGVPEEVDRATVPVDPDEA